jgi:hypothetical protein
LLGQLERHNAYLHVHSHLLVRAERNLEHELPNKQEAVVHELADPAASNSWALYEQTVRSTPFAKLATAEGRLEVRTNAKGVGGQSGSRHPSSSVAGAMGWLCLAAGVC